MNPQPAKTIYFIRHGEDEQGKAQLYQSAESPLTEHGKHQALLVARWVKHLDAEHIFSSPMTRAIETARAIQEETSLPIEELHLVREYLAPSIFLGKPRFDDASKGYMSQMLTNIRNPEWHYAEEENYFDLHRRAVGTLTHIADHKAKRMIVVTHAGFMRVLLAAMMKGGEPDPDLAVSLMRFLKPKNTGITEVHWHPEAEWRNTWRLVTLNETTHLSEAHDDIDNSAGALPI